MDPASLEIVRYPDAVLRQIAEPVEKIDGQVTATAARMFEIMYRCRGVGLAGPQAGIPWRIVVANIHGDPERKEFEKVIINPRILERSDEEVREEEGCLSLPGLTAHIVRAHAVTVEYTDLEGRRIVEHADGFLAKMFQHECDHLDGILIADKMSDADRRYHAPLLRDLEERHQRRASRAQR